MDPINFPQANALMTRPAGMAEEQCADVDAWVGELVDEGTRVIVTVWQPTPAEMAELSQGKPVFLWCYGLMPPVALATRNPFENPEVPSGELV